MKFSIVRTSDRGSVKVSPYIGCTRETLTGRHKVFDTPWAVDVWVMDINTLEELLTFRQAFPHDLVLGEEPYSGMPEIEIYDDYRE